MKFQSASRFCAPALEIVGRRAEMRDFAQDRKTAAIEILANHRLLDDPDADWRAIDSSVLNAAAALAITWWNTQ